MLNDFVLTRDVRCSTVCVNFDRMKKSAALPSIALVILFSAGCKQASFLRQKYTHYGHSKPHIAAERPKRQYLAEQKAPDDLRVQPFLSFTDIQRQVTTVNESQLRPREHNGRRALMASAVPFAKNGLTNSWSVKRIKHVPAAIKKYTGEQSKTIPIISPLLRIILVILLIVLVALVIILVTIL